jgi:hypothetical protein
MRIAPRLPQGNNLDISTFGSSALSMIKSQWSLLATQALTESTSCSSEQVFAIARKESDAVEGVVASIQKMYLNLD